MENLIEKIDSVSREIKSSQEISNLKIADFEKKSKDLETKNQELENNNLELKKDIVEMKKAIELRSAGVNTSNDGYNEIAKKYIADFNKTLKSFARGDLEVKSEYLENAEKLAKIVAKNENFGDSEEEKKFAKALMDGASKTEFPLIEIKTQLTGVGTDGGFGIMSPQRLPLYQTMQEEVGLIDLVSKININTNQAERVATRAIEEGFWEGEQGSDKTINFGYDKITIGTSIVKGSVPVTRTLVEDWAGNLYSDLNSQLQESLNFAIEKSLFMGDGINGRPTGIANYNEYNAKELEEDKYVFGKIKAVSCADEKELLQAIVNEGIIGKSRRKDIMMHKTTLASLLAITDTNGRPLVQTNYLMDGARFMISGMRVYTSDFCPKFNVSGSKAVYIGDFARAYDMVVKTGRTIMIDPYKNNGEIIHYMLRQRVGGGVKGFDSLTILKKA